MSFTAPTRAFSKVLLIGILPQLSQIMEFPSLSPFNSLYEYDFDYNKMHLNI